MASRIATGLTVLVIVFALLVTLGPVSVGIESDPKETPQRAATPFLQEGEGARASSSISTPSAPTRTCLN